ncbi:divergent polysaccharide deacetylase family protein [archaeon]|nr:divergent polysaccharide deacetylase family protein [archaeon]
MRKKKDPRKYIVLIIIGVLTALIGIALVLDDREKPVPVKQVRQKSWPLEQDVARVTEYALPDLLIKGCLFELGISGQDARIKGRTIKIAGDALPTREEITRAFKPIDEVGYFEMENDGHIRVVINATQWEIYFLRPADKVARCAIIIDDMGMSMKHAEELVEIDADLTFAVLPGLPDSRRVSRFLQAKGREILLHLPMQGNGKDPGPGAIHEGMSSSEISAVIRDDAESVPHISGVNNHMGSLVTADETIMRQVMGELKDRKYFFVDSMTTNRSVCETLAGELEVPFIARDVFLDNELSRESISSQMEKVVKIAMKHGEAVAICHPHPETIAVLKGEVPRIRKLGIEIVKISELMDRTDDHR